MKKLLLILACLLFSSSAYSQGTTAEQIVLGTVTTSAQCPNPPYPCWQPITSANPLHISTTGGGSSITLTTTGSSGASVLSGTNLNIPVYSGGAGSTSLSALTSGTATNSIDSTNFAQTWQWSTLTTQTALSLVATGATTGTLLNLTTTGSVNALVITGKCVGCSQNNALYYTATSRTVASTDTNNLITYNSASAGSWTVPNAGSAGFTAPNTSVYISSIGTGALTLTATSSVFNGLGASTTAKLTQNQWAFCVPDASNNYDCISASGAGGAGTGTTGQVAYFSGTNVVTGSSALFQSATGWVGVGTTNPLAPLVVTGFSAANNYTLILNGSSTFGTGFDLDSTGTTGGDAWAVISSNTAGSCGHCFVWYDNTSNSGNGNGAFAAYTTGTSLSELVGNVNLVYGWNTNNQFLTNTLDTGISRDSAGVIDIGTGGVKSKAGSINLTALSATATVSTTTTLKQGTEISCSTGLTTDGSGNINGCVASDKTLKENVQILSYDPTVIQRLKPITYEWLDKERYDAKTHSGFIAQEVQVVDPRAVKSAGKNLLGIDNSALDADIVLDLQSLHKTIAKQQKQIDALRAELDGR